MLYVYYGFQILIIILSIPLIIEKIGPNHIYGFRTSKTLSDEKIWYKANRFGGWCMLIAGMSGIIYLLLLQLCKKQFLQTLRVESWSFLTIIPILVSVVVSLIYIAKIPEEDEKPTEKKKLMELFKTNFAVIVYVFLCFIMILLSAPMAFNKIEPNSTYGFRTGKTLSSEENWYKANQFSGRATITASCVTLIGFFS